MRSFVIQFILVILQLSGRYFYSCRYFYWIWKIFPIGIFIPIGMIIQHLSTALGHMLKPSAQHWADNRFCGGTFLINAFPDQLRAAAIDTYVVTLIMPSEMVSFCGLWCCMMPIYVLEIELVSSFSVLQHYLFYIFVYYLRSVGYIATYEMNFQNC